MIALHHIEKAAEVLRGRVIRTPLVPSPTFSKMSAAEVYLKLENLQETGSFKIRGASFKIQARLGEICPGGVVAASAGNHAQGVALAARRAGLQATIVMPEWASITKQEATLCYGGELVLKGQSIMESIQEARRLAEGGKTFIHPFDDLDIITGQGTVALEILQDLPEADLLFIPIGGGGLISGIAVAAKALRPQVRIIGVQAAACPSAVRAVREGHPVTVEPAKSIADGIAVKQVGEMNLAFIKKYVDEIVLVDEGQIAGAVLLLLERKKILAEGSGAVALAALLAGGVDIPGGSKVVLVVSGGNVDSMLLDRIISQGHFRNGRIARFSVCLDDAPGSLSRLLSLVAGLKANVLHIYHDRSGRDLPIHLSRVELELETRGHPHIREVARELKSAGYDIQSCPVERSPLADL